MTISGIVIILAVAVCAVLMYWQTRPRKKGAKPEWPMKPPSASPLPKATRKDKMIAYMMKTGIISRRGLANALGVHRDTVGTYIAGTSTAEKTKLIEERFTSWPINWNLTGETNGNTK